MAKKIDHKEELHKACLAYANKRIATATEAYDMAQDAANEESKNSAGDDDNSKAMLQIEAEQQAKHVAEARKLKEEMLRIVPSNKSSQVGPGTVVKTNSGNYFISISAGKIEVGKDVYFAVSLSSPIGQALKGLKSGDKVKFNDKSIEILDIY